MKLEEKDIKKLEHIMSKHRIASVDELIAVIERGQRFGKHAGGRPRTITNEKRRKILDESERCNAASGRRSARRIREHGQENYPRAQGTAAARSSTLGKV